MSARIALLAAVCLMAACSSGSSPAMTPTTPSPPSPPTSGNPPEPPPPPPPAGPPTITITATGVSPKEVTVAVGATVLFVNADTRAHELWGGPDHNNRNCPEVDVAGFLVPGQSRATGVYTVAQVCEFHDHTNLLNPAYQGRIIVQ